MTLASHIPQGERTPRSNCAAEPWLESAPVIDSAQLFADRKEVYIYHAGEVYRLRVTRNGKLILNK